MEQLNRDHFESIPPYQIYFLHSEKDKIEPSFLYFWSGGSSTLCRPPLLPQLALLSAERHAVSGGEAAANRIASYTSGGNCKGRELEIVQMGVSKNAGTQKSTFSAVPAACPVDKIRLHSVLLEKVPAGRFAHSSLQKRPF